MIQLHQLKFFAQDDGSWRHESTLDNGYKVVIILRCSDGSYPAYDIDVTKHGIGCNLLDLDEGEMLKELNAWAEVIVPS